MAQRVKSDKPALVSIPNWDHADQYVRRIGAHLSTIKRAECDAKKNIDKTKAELAKRVKKLQAIIHLYTNSLEAWAVIHKTEFGKQRSKKVNFGTIGWRKSTSTIIKKNTLELIKQLFSKAKAATYIHTKETVDKDALAKLTDEQLALVGARRKIKDDFFVEPDLSKAVDYVE